jgi:anti-sigma B factor antagonist
MDFRFEEKTPAIGIFKLSGSLIGEHDGMPLAEAFNEQMENGCLHFVLDLSDLKHINSSGIGVFIALLTKARKKDGDVAIVNPSAYIRNLLMITKLNSIFQIFENVDIAVQEMKI